MPKYVDNLIWAYTDSTTVDPSINEESNLISAPCGDPAVLNSCHMSRQPMVTQGWQRTRRIQILTGKARSTRNPSTTRKPWGEAALSVVPGSSSSPPQTLTLTVRGETINLSAKQCPVNN